MNADLFLPPVQPEDLTNHEPERKDRAGDMNGVPALVLDSSPASNARRRGMFAEVETPVYPLRRGRGLFVAGLLHLLALVPVLVLTTRYQSQAVQPAEAVAIAFVMAPLRGAGSPSPSARTEPERKETAVQQPKPVEPEPADRPPLAPEPLAPIVAPPTLDALPFAEASNLLRDEIRASGAVVEEPAASTGGKNGSADSSLPPAIGTQGGQSNWAGLVLGRLEQFRRYPAESRSRRQEGVCYVRFTIDRKGHVIASALDRTSGHTLLDREAVALVRRADPLPPPPPELEGDTVTLTVPVEFFLTR